MSTWCSHPALISALLAFGSLACTRTIQVAYRPGVVLEAGKSLAKIRVGIAPLQDERGWMHDHDPKSLSFVGTIDDWKFGLTYRLHSTTVDTLLNTILKSVIQT